MQGHVADTGLNLVPGTGKTCQYCLINMGRNERGRYNLQSEEGTFWVKMAKGTQEGGYPEKRWPQG